MYLTPDELAEQEGIELSELLMEIFDDSLIPACCSEGCMVEPDGICEHGHPSIFLSLCLI